MDQHEYQQGQEIQEGDAPEGMPVSAQQPGVFTRLQNMSRSLVVMIAAGMAGGSINEADTAPPRRSNVRGRPVPANTQGQPPVRYGRYGPVPVPGKRAPVRTPTPSPTRTAVPQQVEEKDAQLIQPNAEVLRLEKEVQKAGFLTINHGYDPKNTAEVAVRAPSIVAPSGYTLMPMTISASVVCNGNGVALIPCPRDIIDQTHLGTFVEVSNKEGKVDVESEIIYSAPNKNGIGYVNPYVKVHLKGVRFQGPLSITVLHYVIVPSYPSITERELVQKMGPQATLELQRAARAGTAVKWTPKTDCRVKALAAAGAVKNGVEPLQGYIYGRDETKKNQIYQTYPQYGAAHYINAVFSPAGALVMDPTTPQDCYVGPQLEFVATSVGAQDNLPAWSSRPIEGANRGIFHGVGKNIGKAVFSTPGFGKEGDWLKQVKPPLVIQQFAQSLWQLRQNNAYGRNVAGNN